MSNTLVAAEHRSTTWYTGLGLIEDAAQVSHGIQSNSWVDESLGTVGGSLDILGMAIDPLGSLASWGVSWLMEHVKPLQDALDWLAGDPDEVAAHSATWANVAQFTGQARQQYADAVEAETGSWQGASGDAYREHAGIQLSMLEGTSTAAHGISCAVQGAGLLVGLVRGIVRDLIAQFVATLAARLPQWLAEEGLTLGIATPVVIGQVAALVAKWVNKIQHFVRALLNSLRRLRPLLGRLGEILAGLKQLSYRLARVDPLRRGDVPGAGHGTGAGWREGDPIPPPRDGNELSADASLLDRYKGEDDPHNPNRAFYPSTVRYMTPEEREECRLFVDGEGLLRSAADGDLFDTTTGMTHWSGGGRAIFVMDEHGNLYASDQEVGVVHHSSLLAGAPVAGAGEIEVRSGTLLAMTDRSGHYWPTAETNDRALQSLNNQGLQLGSGFKQYGWGGNER